MKNQGKAASWLTPLELHVFLKLGDTLIIELTQIDIKGCISPIWKIKNETASKALSRLNIAIKHAAELGIDVDMQLIPKAKALLGKLFKIPKIFQQCYGKKCLSFFNLKMMSLYHI